MKAIVFVNGTVEEAVEAVAEVRSGLPAEALRAVVPIHQRQQFIAAARLAPRQVLMYSSWLWPIVFLRLLCFLGLNRGPQVACLATDHSGGLKLLALSLRGRVSLRLPDGQVMQLTIGHFLWLAWQTSGRQPGDLCLIGAAQPEKLSSILADLRRRHPQARIHGLLSAEAAGLPVDSQQRLGLRGLLAACRRRPRFAGVVIPLTGGGRLGIKLCAWLLPLSYRELYNENNDSFPARDLPALLRHMRWRSGNAWLDFVILLRRITARATAIPPGVTVLGSASEARLAAVVSDVRRRHPARCHGLLPPELLALAPLFDSVTLLNMAAPGTWRALFVLAFGRHRSGYLVIPCTGEGHGLLKAVIGLLPLGRREIYNENNDVYSVRELRVLIRHVGWRVRGALRELPERAQRWRDWLVLPPNRVTVVGSASGLYLKAVVADLRRTYPGAGVHALLPASLVKPAAHLFDSYTVLDVLSPRLWLKVARLAAGSRRSGYLVIPWTNEGYTAVKLLGFFLPLGRRRVYNENGDSCLVRQWRMMARHARWRLHHRIFFQTWSERRGRLWPLHVVHLLLYPVRLLAGAALLLFVRLRGRSIDYRVPLAGEEPSKTEEVLSAPQGPIGASLRH